MKTLTVWREEKNLVSQFKDGDKVIGWEDLAEEEKRDFIFTLYQFARFFEKRL